MNQEQNKNKELNLVKETLLAGFNKAKTSLNTLLNKEKQAN